MEWLSDDEGGQWQCEYCTANNLQEARNCEGIDGHPFALSVFDHVFTQCPIASLDPEAVEMCQFILLCEGGMGLGSSRILPSEILQETQWYWNVRHIVLAEQGKIEKLKTKKQKYDSSH